MRIVTWNVNSVKSRLQHLLAWLKETSPDIVLLQELKCIEEAFPLLEIEDAGYNVAVLGQKTYNGVAILSKLPLEDIQKGVPGNEDDDHARYIEAVASLPGGGAVRVASVYVPNGNEVGSDKFAHKMRFLERLGDHMHSLLQYEEITVIGGDYNVAPYPCDVYDPERLDGTVCYHPDERTRLRRLFNLGYYDAYRLAHPLSAEQMQRPSGEYSWWDYRGASFAADKGFRIDHLLLSPQATDKLKSCTIEKQLRALDKPSDHAPVTAELNL